MEAAIARLARAPSNLPKQSNRHKLRATTERNIIAYALPGCEANKTPRELSLVKGRVGLFATAARSPPLQLRGAAALSIAGVLSPRFGLLFAEGEREERDPILAGRRVA